MIGITGATGFIGKNLLKYFQDNNITFKVLARKNSNIKYLEKIKANFEIIDYSNVDSFKGKIEDIEILLHISGLTKSLEPEKFYLVNYEYTKNLVQAFKKYNRNLKHFILFSSQAVTGASSGWDVVADTSQSNPVSNYGKSKLLAEKELISSDLNYTILRITSVFGPYDFDGLNLFKMALSGIVFSITFEDLKVNLIYVKELVRLVNLILNNDKVYGKIYHVGYPEAIDMKKFVSLIRKTAGKSERFLYLKVPYLLGLIVGNILEVYQKIFHKISIINKEKIIEIGKKYWIADCYRLYNDLNVKVKYDINQLVKDTLNWYRENGYI